MDDKVTISYDIENYLIREIDSFIYGLESENRIRKYIFLIGLLSLDETLRIIYDRYHYLISSVEIETESKNGLNLNEKVYCVMVERGEKDYRLFFKIHTIKL